MPKLLTGAPVSAGIYAQVRAKVSLPGAQPCLAAVSVGT